MRQVTLRHRAILALFMCGLAAGSGAQQVVVDTGHSTEKPGATGPAGKREFDLNRQLTMALVKALRAKGLRVEDVAAAGSPPSLQARTQASSGAALFISIHHDSILTSKYNLYEMCMFLRNGHLIFELGHLI